jgi:hypothetical protein
MGTHRVDLGDGTTPAPSMTEIQKMDAFYAALGALCEHLGIEKVVLQVKLTENTTVTTWWPGCSTDCETPSVCSAHAFSDTAASMLVRAKSLLEGSAIVVKADDKAQYKN